MSDEIKLALYRDGRYAFKAPPVHPGRWGDMDWVRWIDACKGWRPQTP